MYGDPGDDYWEKDINGALAEMVLARWLDRYWEPLMPNGKVDHTNGDVGKVFQARSIDKLSNSLILHDRDDDMAAFYLIHCNAPRFTLLGWILGRDGKRQEWWQTRTGRPCYFVPQSALNPCDTGSWIRAETV